MRFRFFGRQFDRLFADHAAAAADRAVMLVLLRNLQAQGTSIMSQLDDLKAQVAANRSVTQSALVLINGIADRITAAGTDPAALAQLTSDLKSDDDVLAAGVTANTPASPAAGT